MWGNRNTFHRHIKLLNSWGFDVVTFDLYYGNTSAAVSPWGITGVFQFVYRGWVRQIQDVLDSFDGPKIVFSMSGPSMSGLIACEGRVDIVKYVCDGGPFAKLWKCTLRMMEQQSKIPTVFLRIVSTTLATLYWGPQAYGFLNRALNSWPSDRPLLSIRGLKDPIVPPDNIAAIFTPHPHLPLTVCEIPEGQHLDGLKSFPEIYTQALERFLLKV